MWILCGKITLVCYDNHDSNLLTLVITAITLFQFSLMIQQLRDLCCFKFQA